MKTTQLFQQALPYTKWDRYDQVPQEAQPLLVGCLSAAVSDWFELAPDKFKHEPASSRALGGTTEITVQPVSDSCILAAPAFDDDQLGSTVTIEGDSRQNIVAGRSKLRRPYAGPTPTEPVPATLYRDAIVFFDEGVDRVVGELSCQESGKLLQQAFPAANQNRMLDHPYSPLSYNSVTWWNTYFNRRATGTYPTTYVVEDLALSQISEDDPTLHDSFLLRVDPIPLTRVTIDFTISRQPRPFKVEHFIQGIEVPVPGTLIQSTLFPLFLARLTATPYWKDPDLKGQVFEDAKAARARTQAIPKHRARPGGAWRTQPGF